MGLINRRCFLGTGLAAGLTSLVSGCNSEFYKTGPIRKKTDDILESREEFVNKIIENRDNLATRYADETGTISPPHPERKNEALVRVNEDGTYRVTYEVEFGDPASIKTTVEEQLNGIKKDQEKKAVVSLLPDTNKLMITLKERTDLSSLETILGDADQFPSQILLKFSATADFGDRAQDYASELRMEIKSKGEQFGAITDNAKFLGALERLRARVGMGAEWGGQINTSLFDLKAILNTLESWGYASNIFETYILLANNREGSLGGEEKLPIPEQILSGVTPVITQKMESLKSDFKGTAIVYDKATRLTFTAGVANAKRPDIKRPDFLVPARDEVSVQGIYLPIGIPNIIAGKLIEMEIGVNRRDSILRWLSQSKDYERRLTRILYDVTPYQAVNWDNSHLKNPRLRYEVLQPAEIPKKAAA